MYFVDMIPGALVTPISMLVADGLVPNISNHHADPQYLVLT